MPEPVIISGDEAKQKSAAELFAQLAGSPQGLSGAEAGERLVHYGPNALEEKKEHPFLKFFCYFWGPIPWMIEVAAVLSAVVKHWGIFSSSSFFWPLTQSSVFGKNMKRATPSMP